MDLLTKLNRGKQDRFINPLLAVIFLAGLYLSSTYHFLLFHTLAEVFSIVIAYSIFLIAWNSRDFTENCYLPILGVVYFFVGSIDLIHTLGYYGMGIFKGYDANFPTQLWIAARYLESISLVIVFFFKLKVKHIASVFMIYVVVFTTLVVLIFWGLFPECYIEGTGLTPFKKISEYIISIFLVVSIVIIIRYRQDMHKTIKKWLILSLLLTIGSELMFTFYISVYGISNLFGHYLKIVSFYFIYKALIETSLRMPYTGLFKKLHESNARIEKREKELKLALKEKEMLLKEVYHRTKNNMTVISSLLNLKSGELSDPYLINILKDASNRIVSMALVQEKLYKSGDLHTISLPEYIKELSDRIDESYKSISKDIKLKIDIEPSRIQTDTAVSMGLIINELLSNAYKYAFIDRPNGEISICYKTIQSGEKELIIIDNGVGLPADFNITETTTLGLQLVNLTVIDQLKGTLEIKSENGTGFYIRLNIED